MTRVRGPTLQADIISGAVTDPSKSPLAGAEVSIANSGTNVRVWVGETNESGI